MNARIVRPEARTLLNGTSGQPAIVGTMHDENGRIVVVYADGCMAVRACRTESATLGHFTRDIWQWEPMEGPDYIALFCRDAAPAAVPVPLADAPEPKPDVFADMGLHPSYCECPFPAPKRGNLICGNCEGWVR